MSIRRMKKQVFDLLRQDDLDGGLLAISAMPPRQVINPLFGLLYHTDARVHWHAVTAMGVVAARLAGQDFEAARVIMRRLMWNLNDESGGIGWGSPEAMGEIMASQGRLAEEYAAILISYLNPEGNYLEHEGLQQGALWGFGRLARERPLLAAAGAPFLHPYLASPETGLRGLAIWAATPLIDPSLRDLIRPLRSDPTIIMLYSERQLRQVSIADLARAALAGGLPAPRS
jgi:hypothetical protein